MAGELYITNPGDASNFYVVIRRLSDDKVWDVTNTTFATWADGGIDDYDVALVSKGGDLYKGDFPTGITAGTRVLVQHYKRAGATPAITDSLFLTIDVTWNGATLASGSSIALDARALTTLASIKRALAITGTTYDTLLTELINQVSARIERLTGRHFAAAEYNEWVCTDGEHQFTIRNWPIVRVNRVRYCTDTAIRASYTGSDIEAVVSVYYDDDGGSGTARLLTVAADGTETSNTFAFSTYKTLSTLATAMNAISGWTVSLYASRDGQSLSLWPSGGIDAKNTTGELYAVTEFDRVTKVDHRRGMVSVAGTSMNLLVSYRGGYEVIPDDVARVANEMTASSYHEISVNPMLASESIPDYSYSLANKTEIASNHQTVLDAYRSFAIGGVC